LLFALRKELGGTRKGGTNQTSTFQTLTKLGGEPKKKGIKEGPYHLGKAKGTPLKGEKGTAPKREWENDGNSR